MDELMFIFLLTDLPSPVSFSSPLFFSFVIGTGGGGNQEGKATQAGAGTHLFAGKPCGGLPPSFPPPPFFSWGPGGGREPRRGPGPRLVKGGAGLFPPFFFPPFSRKWSEWEKGGWES